MFGQVHNFTLLLFCFGILFSKITLRQKINATLNLLTQGRNVRSPGISEINELVINWYEKAAHYAAIPREFSAVKEKDKTRNNTINSHK